MIAKPDKVIGDLICQQPFREIHISTAPHILRLELIKTHSNNFATQEGLGYEEVSIYLVVLSNLA